MAKDAKGHGSEKRGGATPLSDAAFVVGHGVPKSPFQIRQEKEISDREAADTLAAPGNPKSVAAPVHPDAAGRSDFWPRPSPKQQMAENKAWQQFHKERKSSGPHYLDPHDPRGRRK